MLEETRESYLECANMLVPDWKDMSKNQLAFDSLTHKKDRHYDGYVSALMLKYWNKMLAYYHRCKLVATPEDVHSWLVMAVMYALDNHPWTNPSSSIYQDKNGPDKVINRVMESRRVTFYQQLNRYNRKINSSLISLESLSDDMADAYTPMCEDEHTFIIDDLVIKAFEVKDYFTAFLVDAIVSERYKVGGRHKKLVTHLKNLDYHCETFADRYDLSLETVKKAATYITRLDRAVMKKKIDDTMSSMKRKLLQEQSGSSEFNGEETALYNANEIVEFYYVELWEDNVNSEVV